MSDGIFEFMDSQEVVEIVHNLIARVGVAGGTGAGMLQPAWDTWGSARAHTSWWATS
jgi:hypothetical protein